MPFQDFFVPSQVSAARLEKGVEAPTLAQALGLTTAQLLDMEEGRLPPTEEHLLLLAQALDCELAFFGQPFLGTALEGCVAPGGSRICRPLDEELIQRLHTALDHGQVSQRKAAQLLQLSLEELDGLFSSHGMRDPVRTFADEQQA